MIRSAMLLALPWLLASASADDLAPYVVAGDPGASRTIVQHSDFQCPHCAHALQVLTPLVAATPDVRLVLVPWTLDGACNPHVSMTSRPERCALAAAAECSARMGRYADVVPGLYGRQDDVARAPEEVELVIGEVAARARLSPRRVDRCMADPSTSARLRAMAGRVKLEGTPTFAVGRRGAPLALLDEHEPEAVLAAALALP